VVKNASAASDIAKEAIETKILRGSSAQERTLIQVLLSLSMQYFLRYSLPIIAFSTYTQDLFDVELFLIMTWCVSVLQMCDGWARMLKWHLNVIKLQN
jgi:hypothetical protein